MPAPNWPGVTVALPFPPPAPLYSPPLAYFPYPPPPIAQTLGRLASPYRWGASAIDLLLMYGSWNAVVVALLLAGRFETWLFALLVAGVYVWAYAYYALQDAFVGGTVGKHVLGLALVDAKLEPIRARQGAARALEVFLWLFGVLVGMALVQWILIRKGGQGAADRLVGTYVVRKRALVEVGARPAR